MTKGLSKFAVHANRPFRALVIPATPLRRDTFSAPGCVVRSPLEAKVLTDQRKVPLL